MINLQMKHVYASKKSSKILIDKKYVDDHLGDLANGKTDLSKFIL